MTLIKAKKGLSFRGKTSMKSTSNTSPFTLPGHQPDVKNGSIRKVDETERARLKHKTRLVTSCAEVWRVLF